MELGSSKMLKCPAIASHNGGIFSEGVAGVFLIFGKDVVADQYEILALEVIVLQKVFLYRIAFHGKQIFRSLTK